MCHGLAKPFEHPSMFTSMATSCFNQVVNLICLLARFLERSRHSQAHHSTCSRNLIFEYSIKVNRSQAHSFPSTAQLLQQMTKVVSVPQQQLVKSLTAAKQQEASRVSIFKSAHLQILSHGILRPLWITLSWPQELPAARSMSG